MLWVLFFEYGEEGGNEFIRLIPAQQISTAGICLLNTSVFYTKVHKHIYLFVLNLKHTGGLNLKFCYIVLGL